MRTRPTLLVNTADIELWPAWLLHARGSRDARLLARADYVLRRKRDGRYLAASFDAPREWGSEYSALIMWRIEDRAMLARVPSWNAEWRHIVWLPGEPAVAATRFSLVTRESDVAVIIYRP